MCKICVEWQAGKLTTKEAFQNMGEVINTTDDEEVKRHLFELSNKLLDSEVPFKEVDSELDEHWYKELKDE